MNSISKIIIITLALIITRGGHTLVGQINVGVSGTPSVVNAYYPVTAISGNTITIGAGTGIAHTLAANDRVLLIQMTGNTAANGGKFEYAKVTSVAGSNVTVDMINRAYSPATEKVQLVWVPYDPVGITIIANILAKDWDGTTGGIVSLMTPGTLTMNGSILADGAGFRYIDGTNTINGSDIWYGGGGGHGVSYGGGGGGGYGSPGINVNFPSTNGTYNGGAPFSNQGGGGGGGGSGSAGSHGGGGGGGAGYAIGGCGGQGSDEGGAGGLGHVGNVADTNGEAGVGTAGGGYSAIWGYVSYYRSGGGGGGSQFIGGGGGGGSYFSQDPDTGQPLFANGEGGFAGSNGGGGGPGGLATGGSGGGSINTFHTYHQCDAAGNCNDPRVWMGGGAQGLVKGGGIILIKAHAIIPQGRVLSANGDNGELLSAVLSNSGGSGGGGGGTVVLNIHEISSTLLICAKGGDGKTGASDTEHGGGSGGAGGGGLVWVNDPLGGIGDNISGTPPALNKVSFCIDGALGGAPAPNPKNASFTGGGGCGGTGLSLVNPNDEVFGCNIKLELNTPCNCPVGNSIDLNIKATFSEIPVPGTIVFTTSNGETQSFALSSSLIQTFTINNINTSGSDPITITAISAACDGTLTTCLPCFLASNNTNNSTVEGYANSSSTATYNAIKLVGPIDPVGTAVSQYTGGNCAWLYNAEDQAVIMFDDLIPEGNTVTISLALFNTYSVAVISDGINSVTVNSGTPLVIQHIPFVTGKLTDRVYVKITTNEDVFVDGAYYNIAVSSSNTICTLDCSLATCAITAVTATPTACVPATNTYSVNGSITFSNAPATGTLTVSIGAVTQTFNAPFTSPQAYTLAGLTADGASHTVVTAVFSADAACTATQTYIAPAACAPTCIASQTHTTPVCNNNSTAGNAGDDYFSFSVTGTVTDGSGNYVVKIGAWTSPSIASGQAVSIVGNGLSGNPSLPANGSNITVRVEDAVTSTCFTTFTVSSAACSTCPTPNCGTVTVQKN